MIMRDRRGFLGILVGGAAVAAAPTARESVTRVHACPHIYNTMEDVDRAVEAVATIVGA